MSATPIAKLTDLVEPLLFDSPEHVTRFDRETGRMVTKVPYEDDTEGRRL